MGLRIRWVRMALVGAVFPVLASAEEPAKAPPVETVVARPVTPGTLGLLARASGSPAAHEYVKKAVRHADANTRASAARMAYVLGAETAKGDLRAALEAETSPEAAAEQACALLRLSSDDDEAILRLSARIEHLPLERAARRLAFLRPAVAVARLPLLSELGLGEPSQREVLEIAILADPKAVESLGWSILERGDGYAWGFFLGAHERVGVSPARGLLAAGVGKDAIRAATLQWMAAGAWYPGPKAGQLFDALAKVGPGGATLDGWLLEIIRRQGGRPPVPLSGSVAEEAGAQLGPLLIRPKVRAVLTVSERMRLAQTIYGDPELLVGPSEWAQPAPLSQPMPEVVAAHPPGFLRSVLQESRCEPEDGLVVVAHAEFDALGLPQNLVALLKASGLSGECGVAAAAVLWTHVSPLPRPSEKSTTLVVSLGPDAVSCSQEPDAKTRDIADVWGKKMIEPERAKAPRPIAGRKAGKTVALSVEIAPNGCVRSASPTLGADASLVPEALRTVAGWRYARFTSEGKPVSFRTVAHVTW